MIIIWFMVIVKVVLSITFFTDTNKLLHKNCSNYIERQIWNLSYAPFTITCPIGNLIRKANDVCMHISIENLLYFGYTVIYD